MCLSWLALGPIYSKHVQAGRLASWTWLQHYSSGEYRRLLALTAADHSVLLKTRDTVIDKFQDRKVKKAADEFREICYAHSDLMWDVQIETP